MSDDSLRNGDIPRNWLVPSRVADMLPNLRFGQPAPGRVLLLQFRRPLSRPELETISADLTLHLHLRSGGALGAAGSDVLYVADEQLAADPDPNQHLSLAQLAAGARARLTRQPESCRFLQVIDTNDSTISVRPSRWQRVTREGEPIFDVGRYTYSLGDIADEFLHGYPLDHDLQLESGNVADAIAGLSPIEAEELVKRACRRLHLVDDESGIDETNLLCRAALEIIRI